MGRSVRIELELELDADTIVGTLSSPDVPSHPFDGWLALASAIERARAAAATAPDPAAENPIPATRPPTA